MPLYQAETLPTLTAHAGGGQAAATPLVSRVNLITTSAAAVAPFDSVQLPSGVGGIHVVVVNGTNNPIQVFGAGTDTINGVAAGTGVTMPPNSIDVFACPVSGQWFVEGGIGYSGSLACELATDNITAHAGGGQGGATPLTAQTNRVTTAAAAVSPFDSILMPASAAGLELLVINHGANPIQVFGAGTDTIDDVAAATGVTQMAGSMCIYSCATAGKWYSNGIGTGYSGSLPTVSFADALTAHAGGGQAAALQLATVLNRVTTVASGGDSAKLPVSAGGLQITVINAAAANSMNVFPQTGDQINALGANTAFALAAGKVATFYCTVAGQWHSILSA